MNYQGSVTLPGESNPRKLSLELDSARETVSLSFDPPVEGGTLWEGTSVRVAQRLKYSEVTFITAGLPKENVELTWKFNASLLDDTLAGVVIARPNDQRITGERGFTLARPVTR